LTIDLRGKTNQFGYIYIQPWESDTLIFDDSAVNEVLGKGKGVLPLTAYEARTWPQSPLNTNFRMASVDYQQPKETNYGHSEYLLLANNGFDKMLSSFTSNPDHNDCPQYVILYSYLLPCTYPPNPVSQGNDPVPRCAELTVLANKSLKKSCPGAVFYVYTNEVSDKDYPEVFEATVKNFKNKGIIWIHP
jgi:hypothetical protein